MFACKCGEIFVRITGLQPKQRQMLALIEAEGPHVATKPGFGGSRGAAKSRILRDAMLLRRFKNPGTAGFIIRRNWSDLEENHLEKFKLERPGLMQFYSSARQSFEFPNGSRIAFRYADTTDQIQAIARGPEAMDIAIDQAEQFTGNEIALLTTTNRWPGAGPGVCKSWLFFNVGDRGAEYLRRVYWLRQYEGSERPEDFVFIQAYGFDNFEWFRNEIPGITFDEFYKIPGDIPPCEDGKYSQAWLDAAPKHNRFVMFVTRTTEGRKMWGQPETIRMGDLFGDFSQFSGQYYAGVWQPERCVIPAHLAEDIIKSWHTHWLAIDWGFAHSAAAGWFATCTLKPSEFKKYFGKDIDYPIDIVIIKKELVVDHMGEGDFATEICDMTTEVERRNCRDIWMSPDAWHKRGSADTIGDQITKVLKTKRLPTPERADDDRVGGWRLIWNCLKQTCSVLSDVPEHYPGGFPMLLVSAECNEVVSMFPMLITDPKKREDVLKTDTTYDDVADCLTADTQVFTEHGYRPICNVLSGEKVWTRKGLRTVEESWLARKSAAVLCLHFSDGTSIRCTEDHRFWVENEWRAAKTMRYGDKIESCGNRRRTLFLSTENTRWGRTEAGTTSRQNAFFTEIFGGRFTDRFLKTITFTIKTRIRSITTSQILNACPLESIPDYTSKNGLGAAMEPLWLSSKKLALGIQVLLAWSGIKNMAAGWQKMAEGGAFRLGRKWNANSAATCTWGSKGVFAPISASPHGEERCSPITLTERAWFAVKNFAAISMSRLNTAPGSAVRFLGSEKAGYADVYDLQVEDEREFYANGILVHNCVRYGLKSKLTPNAKIPREVRVREVLESAGEDPTNRAMKMRVFEHNEQKGQRAFSRPRWRV